MGCAKSFLSESRPVINPGELRLIAQRALKEDIGRGDITTRSSIPKNISIQAQIIAKEDFIFASSMVLLNIICNSNL